MKRRMLALLLAVLMLAISPPPHSQKTQSLAFTM